MQLLIISAMIVLSSPTMAEKAFSEQMNQETFDKFDWGSIWAVDYLDQRYFAAYANGLLYDLSKDRDLIKNKWISRILRYDTTEETITSNTPLMLEEGYELAIASVDAPGNKAYVKLFKEDKVVDSAVISQYFADGGLKMKDTKAETLVYKINKGKSNEIDLLTVHFANCLRGPDQNIATVDNIRQVSDTDPSKVIYDDNSKKIFTDDTPLKLKEGYELILRAIDIDGKKAYLDLNKTDDINGSVTVFSRVVQPPADVSDTYTYSMKSEGSKERELLSVHFKGSMRAVDKNLIIIDHILQFPENGTGSGPSPKALTDNRLSSIITANFPLKLEEGYELLVKALDIKGDKIYVELQKDGEIVDSAVVMPKNDLSDTYSYGINRTGSRYRELISIHFKNSLHEDDQNLVTVDQIWQASESQPLQSYYDDTARIITPDTPLKLEEGYELAVAALDVSGSRAFLELSRDGDLVDSGIIAPKNDGPDSYTYALDMGEGKEMEILSVHFKNAYHSPAEDAATADRIWQVSESRPSQVLIDEDGKWMLNSTVPLQLEEGYVLAIKAVDREGDRACFELYKDGILVDYALVVLPQAKAADETYTYSRDLGETKDIVVIAAHFKNAFRGADQDLATIDGTWQISDTPTKIPL